MHRTYGISEAPHDYVTTPNFTKMRAAGPPHGDGRFETLPDFIGRAAGSAAPREAARRRTLLWAALVLFVVIAAVSVALNIR